MLLKRAIFDPTQLYLEMDRGNLSEYNILNIYNTNSDPNPSELSGVPSPNNIYSKWVSNGKLLNIDKPAYYLMDRVVTYPDGRVFSLSCVVGLINIHKQNFNVIERQSPDAVERRLAKTQQVGANIRALQVGYTHGDHLETTILEKVKEELPHLCLSTGSDIKLKVSLWKIPSSYNETISDYYRNIDLTIVHDTTNYYTMKAYKDALREHNGDHHDDTKTYDYSLAVITNFQHQAGAIKMYIKAVHKKYLDMGKLTQMLDDGFVEVGSDDITINADDQSFDNVSTCSNDRFAVQINGKLTTYSMPQTNNRSSDDTLGSHNDFVEKCLLHKNIVLASCQNPSSFDPNTHIVSIPDANRVSQMLDNPDDYVIFYPCTLTHKDELTIIEGSYIYPHKTFYMNPPVFDGLLINNITSPSQANGVCNPASCNPPATGS